MIPLPLKPKVISEKGNEAVFEIEGLYPGYGHTVGNSLRRVMLSSLSGAAITSIKIEGAGHEFTTLEGLMEDMVELTLNLKQLRFKVHGEGPFSIKLSAKGEKEVAAKDFTAPSQVEIINKDFHIATLSSKGSKLNLEATVEIGKGYVPVESRTKEKVEVGTIALDAVFSPVRHVNYEVENMRVEDRTDYNKVRLHIITDGSITPREALAQAAKILVGQFEAIGEGFEEVKKKAEIAPQTKAPEEERAGAAGAAAPGADDFLKMKLDDLKLSSRALNVLREAGIKTVGGLSRKKESTLEKVEGLGEKGMQEIKKALGNFGITLKQ